MINWNEKLRASGLHLGISVGIAALAAVLVFAVWYPYPYREVSGGRNLFMLVVTVDVLLGPLATLVVFNRRKPWRELRRDLALVGLVQVAGLAYGLWTVAVARPVHLAFELDRFRIVHAVDVPEQLLDRTPAGVQALPWFGPTMLAVRPFRDERERFEATMAALQGLPLSARPDLWEPYEGAARGRVRNAAKPATQLLTRFAARAGEIEAAIKGMGRTADSTAYLPLAGRQYFWTALIDPATADIVGYLALDSF